MTDDKLAKGRVVTEDAPVTFDNTFYFTLRPAKLIKVVEIGPSPVAQALYGNEPLFGYTYFKPQTINFGVLRDASLVLVREVPQMNAGLRDALEQVRSAAAAAWWWCRRPGLRLVWRPGARISSYFRS